MHVMVQTPANCSSFGVDQYDVVFGQLVPNACDVTAAIGHLGIHSARVSLGQDGGSTAMSPGTAAFATTMNF